MNPNRLVSQSHRLYAPLLLVLTTGFLSACTPGDENLSQDNEVNSETAMSYPDWRGQWKRGSPSLNWSPEGYEVAGPPPLNEEYMAIWQGYTALQESGIPAGDPPSTCLPQCMPMIMKMVYPMEIIITPEITYIYAEWNSQFRRVYTDGRDWPGYILPAFNGYSIGEWHDEDNDGTYDMLSIETRAIKGPRAFDSKTVP